jgi:hypothetical protein
MKEEVFCDRLMLYGAEQMPQVYWCQGVTSQGEEFSIFLLHE